VTCPANPPACPDCDQGEECQIISQNCTQCAQSLCINPVSLGLATPTPKPNTGAIAGGIVAALLVIVAIAAGFFFFVRKKRRATRDMDQWLDKSGKPIEEEEMDDQGRPTGTAMLDLVS
jgi:protein OPY2